MLKKILLLMCLLVALSGVASAEIILEVDEFNETKYVYSCFEKPNIKEKGIDLRNVIFRKHITDSSVKYILICSNIDSDPIGKNRFPVYNDFLIKFDDDIHEIYTLSRYGDFTLMSRSVDLIAELHEIVLTVPEDVVKKILSSDKITIRVPLYPKELNKNKTLIRNFTFDISQEMINEWRQVILAE